MPQFEIVLITEPMRRGTAGSRRQRILQESQGFIARVGPGQAGKLLPSEGETSMTLRRRATSVANGLGLDLEVKWVGEEVYFWAEQAP